MDATLKAVRARGGRHSASEPLRSNLPAGSYAAMLDSLPTPVALLDAGGRITAVNDAWRRFGPKNGIDDAAVGVGEDYRAAWRRTVDTCPEAAAVVAALEEVLSSRRSGFDMESP